MGIYESLAVYGTSYWLAGCYAIFEKPNVEQAKAGLIARSSDVDEITLGFSELFVSNADGKAMALRLRFRQAF